MKTNKLYTVLALLILSVSGAAQSFADNMEDSMYDSGKINVVIGVILIIMLLFFLYLYRLDRKISKLEELVED